MRVTYYGQACLLIEAAGMKILTDPWLTEGAFSGTWFHTHLLADAGVSPQTIPQDIDYLFLSHEHQDHFDAATLRHFSPDLPVLICKFDTPKFRRHVEEIGFTDIREIESGQSVKLGDDVAATIFGTAEYTNDSAILVEAEGHKVFNETDCKLSFPDYERIGREEIDIGFYMFSGANWYPMLYDHSADQMAELIRHRRRALMRSYLQRVKVTKPKLAIPASGPCTFLAPELISCNWPESGIFIEPAEAAEAVKQSKLNSDSAFMAISDVWDSRGGVEEHAPASFRASRREYILDAATRMAPQIQQWLDAEPPAQNDLGECLARYFNMNVGNQTDAVRKRINTKLAFEVTGPHGGNWTVNFTANGKEFVRDGLSPDWDYKINVQDKLLYPFVNGSEPFFEDLYLTFRIQLARRPEVYCEPLYHFLYEPDPEKLENWYAKH